VIQYSTAVEVQPRCRGVLDRPVEPGDDTILVLGHHAPFGDDGFAHLPGVLRAGDLVDLHRDFLADETLQLRRLRVAVW